jgi:hypothetical protein
MADGLLSFSASEQFRKKIIVSNLEPYFVKGSSTQTVPKNLTYTKETTWIDVPLINQPDMIDTGVSEKKRLYTVNQYGPNGGYKTNANVDLIVNDANEGEFNYSSPQTKKFDEAKFSQKNLITKNLFGPQDGWGDASSELNLIIRQLTTRAEYYTFKASSYSPINILLSKDPTGTLGTLSQDSALAQIAATRLRKSFEDSIALETYQQTIGRANFLQTGSDPYRILNLITGRQPLIEPDWHITVPDSIIGKGLDFISRVTGVYSPYSYIPGDYFNNVGKKSILNQAINTVTQAFGFPAVLPSKKSSSDVFLAYTSGGSRKVLFRNLSLNYYTPDYKANFLSNLNLTAPSGNYYIGSRTSEPLDIVSPSGQIPVNQFGIEVETNVYGPSNLGKLYENNVDFKFGLNQTPTIEGGGVQGGFTWVSPKYKGNAGQKVGVGGALKGQDPEYQPIAANYTRSESTAYPLKQGGILDDTQRLINSQPAGGKRLQHVGNAIDQVSKVFNDGYKEITKGSRVIRYTDTNGIFKGEEYGRVFAKDIPYYDNQKLVKSDGNIRKHPYSILDSTYNLNMYPTSGPESTTLQGGQVKKYMLSLENLAWRTSRRPGYRYTDLPESEKGPNGGRVMWFPPYDLTFSESNSVQWESNTFLGRPEDIYTYKNTSRSGTLSFKVIVDHPSVMNLLVNRVLNNTASSQIADQVIDSFFAGLTKFDIYELSKRYNNFSTTELSQIQKLINGSSNPEKIKDTINQSLNVGGDGAGGSLSSNSNVGQQVYTPQLSAYKSTQFYFDYNAGGGTNYSNNVTSYTTSGNFSKINQSQQTLISSSENALTGFTESIKSLLSSNANVTIEIRLRSNSSYNEGTNIESERNTCVEDTIKSLLNNDKRVKIAKSNGAADETIQPLNYKCDTTTTDQYGTGPVGCRRVIIEDIIETPLPNLNNPNGGVATGGISNLDRLLNQNDTQNGNSPNNPSVPTQESISKQVIRKLLSEADYFKFMKESNPFVYDSLREKLKYFHPAFHSMTPEGLNERLTFLLQCTRPGDTIPTKQPGGTLIDKDARNTAFGAPPICILRVGDFYHSKVVVDSCNFTYDDGKFDLNPEGIGVQPMIVTVTMGFKFIGGQGLKAPIDELQNALSFNFFANTEMYDERATDSLTVSAFNKEFIEKTEPTGDTVKNTNTNLQNEGGTTIGSVEGKFENSGTSVNIAYKTIVNNFIESFNDFAQGEYDKLREVSEQYNSGILMLYTKDQDYKSGKMNEFGGTTTPPTPTSGLTIFGKSTFETKIDTLFSGLLDDINNGRLTIQSGMTQQNFKSVDQTNFNNQLKKLVNDYKIKFTDKLVTTSNELSKVQLSMTRNIDKLNYVVQGLDGYIDTKGIPQIYTIDTGKTVNEIGMVMNAYSTEINKLNTNLITKNIIYSGYNDNQSYQLPGGSFATNTADKRFFLVFGWQLANNYRAFETQVTGSFTSKDWTKFISESLTKNYKIPADNEKKKMSEIFSKYKKETNKVYVPGNITDLIKNKRQTGLTIKTSATENDKTRLQKLYTGQNNDPADKNTFNGKVIF